MTVNYLSPNFSIDRLIIPIFYISITNDLPTAIIIRKNRRNIITNVKKRQKSQKIKRAMTYMIGYLPIGNVSYDNSYEIIVPMT